MQNEVSVGTSGKPLLVAVGLDFLTRAGIRLFGAPCGEHPPNRKGLCLFARTPFTQHGLCRWNLINSLVMGVVAEARLTLSQGRFRIFTALDGETRCWIVPGSLQHFGLRRGVVRDSASCLFSAFA